MIAARYRLPEGPPLVTMPRDVDETVAAWRERRTARLADQRRKARETPLRKRRAAPEAPLVASGSFTGYPVNLVLPVWSSVRSGAVPSGTR